MTIKKDHINAYILAGGKSSRMGSDKGLLLFHGEWMIERIIRQLEPVVERIIIVSNNPGYEKTGREIIKDKVKNIGPAGGIQAVLSHLQTSAAFIVSCDMPFIKTEGVRYLLSHSLDAQITVPVHHHVIQPLFGIYSKDCLHKWNNLVEQKIIKLQEMITHFQLKKINTGEIDLFTELSFININDKNDLKKALQQANYGN